MPRRSLMRGAMLLLATIGATLGGQNASADAIQPMRVVGENFVDPAGQSVRFWGVNLVALYPTHEEAEKIAENLASRGVNLVRPHHMLRPSRDWVTRSKIAMLQLPGNTRTPDPEAWDRFDYLNAELRERGIYLMLSLQWSRRFQPGDVDVLTTDDADRAAWVAAINELNAWEWKKSIDVRKMIAVVDERAAALEIEFARQLLTHVNPYTGIAYGQDPQVLTIEVVNESSAEYAVICGNRFPDYWQAKLEAKWRAFAEARGVEAGDLYKPASEEQKTARAAFLRELDEAWFERMKSAVREMESASGAALTFSNLWRGENALEMHAGGADYIEDHLYIDPLVVRQADDFFARSARTQLAGKPYIIGELNQTENTAAQQRESPVRSMLPLATAAYGSLHNWSGVAWFAWTHGDKPLGADGWAKAELRDTAIGNMIADGMQIDHLRTAGLMFRNHLVKPSAEPITLYVDEPYTAADYHSLMRGKYTPKAGWQNVHGFRKAFGAAPASQASAAWMKQAPPEPLVSDTGEIIKDVKRGQLTVAAPAAEAFSGTLDDAAPAGLKHLRISGDSGGFATVIVVAADNQPIAQSQHLIISRTALDAAHAEVAGPGLAIAGLRSGSGGAWQAVLTRPRESAELVQAFTGRASVPLEVSADGAVTLPAGEWHEIELRFGSN